MKFFTGVISSSLLFVSSIAVGSPPPVEDSDLFVACSTSFYDGQKWTKLGDNQSSPGYSQVDFDYGSVHFSAAANLTQGLMYFGSIYDDETKSGTQLQLSKNDEIHLYFFLKQTQYSMVCKLDS